MVTSRMTPPDDASRAMASDIARVTHVSASSRDMSSLNVSSHHPYTYALPLPPTVNGASTRAPPSGIPYTCGPSFRSHPAMIIPACSRSLFSYAIVLVKLATSFTSHVNRSSAPAAALDTDTACSSANLETYAATFCVSAALPLRHIHTLSQIRVILSLALFATYVPVLVRESAPSTTPSAYFTAMMGVCTVALLTGIVGAGFSKQMSKQYAEFEHKVREALDDGIISAEEAEEIEALRERMGLSKTQAEELANHLIDTKRVNSD